MIDNYHNCPFQITDLSPQSVYVKSGFGKDTGKLINQQIKETFPQSSLAALNNKIGPEDIISFAFIFKQTNFNVKF